MRLNIKTLIALLLTCFFSVNAQSFNVHKLDIETGLSNNYIRTIFSDSQGLMWFGTDTGLDSYDGLQLINYAKRFKTPLKGAVQSIVELQEGVLLIGTSWGAFRYIVSKNEVTPIDFGSPSIDVRFVLTPSKGAIYLATDKGLFRLEWKTLKTTMIPLLGNSNVSLNCLLEDQVEHIWAAGDNGLYRIKPKGRVTLQQYPKNIKVIKSIEKTIYLGTLHGLFAYNRENESITSIKGLEDVSILSLTIDPFENLIVGTDNAGIHILNTKTRTLSRYNQSVLFTSNTICALYSDNSRILWIGTFNAGVYYQNLSENQKFKTIEFENSKNANIRSMYISPEGEKYIGTRDGALMCLDSTNKLKAKTVGKLFRSNILTTIYPYPGKPDLLLIGTFGGGISVFNKKTWTCSSFSAEDVFQSGTAYKICMDSQQHLWIATLNGVYRYNLENQTYTNFDLSSFTGSNEAFTLHSDDKDRVWIGTKTGVCYYSLSKKTFVQPASCKAYRYQCTAAMIDSKGNSWFCFNKGGVLKLDKDLNEKRWLTKEIALPENAPSSLLEDRSGSIWIGSSKGLFRVDVNNEVYGYGREDGMTGIGFCPELATLDQNGNLWWSNENGLVTFLNNTSNLTNQIPLLKFTDLYINGKRFDVDTLRLVTKNSKSLYTVLIKGKSNNNLEFRVVALNYQNALNNRYSFFLEGHDDQWSKPSSNPLVAYAELKPGSYKLIVKVSNNDDLWANEPFEIQLVLTPFFYETVWFSLLLWLIVGVVILYFTRKYIQRVRSKIVDQLGDFKRKTTSVPLKIDEQKKLEIKDKLLAFMLDEKPFLNSELRLSDVANSLGYSIHEISQVLNVELNHNFSDFINSYRVDEVKKKIQKGEIQKYTMTAIAMQCGFNAKSSFQRAFKKATNMTPSEFLKDQGKNSTPET